ncbi:primosomal protein N' [Patescibacteria group bacterium]|nr:primosomal protein N' [Patescibacteria group bacterium]MBU1935381.1 primosomal protein N' [Patescibacteria group bacterium]
MTYIQVIILKRAGEFDDPLTYSVPKELESECAVGKGVHVPLRNRTALGIITEIDVKLAKDISPDKVKPIKDITSFYLNEKQIELAKRIADYYRTSLTRSLRLMIPTQVWKGKLGEPEKICYQLTHRRRDSRISPSEVRGIKQKEIIELLTAQDETPESEINASKATIRSLIEKGIVEEIKKPIYTKPDYAQFPLKSFEHKLTGDQGENIEQILCSTKPVLLHGITGSGKTEIYLRVILEAIKQGKQAILLVPEIALTPQMIDYFKDYFGPHLALFHSKLSNGQRAAEWWKVHSGYAPLVIGSRSVIFAPAQNLGVVILDEEHEWTYKQESSPYYQTHHIGEMLSDLWGSQLILGSATPRLESMYKAKIGDYKYLHLPERINKQELPKVEIVDLRDEFKQKNFSIFSRNLQNKIKERLANKEQIILFVNQRGVARAVVCRDCGYTEECPHCEVSLKLHRGMGRKESALVCHYCGYARRPNLLCPECKSPHIKHVGVGTQRVEEEAGRLFPEARIIRADKDTTSTKEGFEPIYNAFKNGQYDILIGTQMVAKGLDFKSVSLIGIILADIGLHIPDFRSHERLFQLITQVSGRCGRGDSVGQVVLQTYQPDHFAIERAAEHDYQNFSENELKFREKLGYPPFSNLIKFTVVGSDLPKLRKHIKIEEETLEDIFKINNLKFKIVSAPAMIPKMANRYYYHVLIRAKKPHVIFDHWKPPKGWRVDVDPIHTT